MFSATMRLEDSAVDKARREQFVDSILDVSLEYFRAEMSPESGRSSESTRRQDNPAESLPTPTSSVCGISFRLSTTAR